MKVLTLTQPWASLIALDEKRIETRSWYTAYRGPLAIHASKAFPGWAKRQCFIPPFSTVLVRHDLNPGSLPLGKILCVVSIEDCLKTWTLDMDQLSTNEKQFGEYSGGRFAWVLGPITRIFEPPIPAGGRLGLWEWFGPPETRIPNPPSTGSGPRAEPRGEPPVPSPESRTPSRESRELEAR